jgi:nucleoside-diphosphate-sugar epimerase
VDDLADGIVSAIGSPITENQDYNLAGPEGLAYRAIVDTILQGLNRRVTLLNIGLPLASGIVRVAQHIPRFPVTQEQVLRLLEDKVFDISKAKAQLGYNPRSFTDGVVAEIAEMKAAKVI